MNEDRFNGSAREAYGKIETAAGDAADSESTRGTGIADQITGAIQHGYGKAKNFAEDLADNASGVIDEAGRRSGAIARRGEAAARDGLGENGVILLVAGAVALVTLGFLAAKRSVENPSVPQRRLAARNRAPKTAVAKRPAHKST